MRDQPDLGFMFTRCENNGSKCFLTKQCSTRLFARAFVTESLRMCAIMYSSGEIIFLESSCETNFFRNINRASVNIKQMPTPVCLSTHMTEPYTWYSQSLSPLCARISVLEFPAAKSLAPLLKKAKEKVPQDLHSSTPIAVAS